MCVLTGMSGKGRGIGGGREGDGRVKEGKSEGVGCGEDSGRADNWAL